MKVVYVGRDTARREALLKKSHDILLLGFDRWDDYNFKTTFPTECRIGGVEVETGSIKILIKDEMVSFDYLDQQVAKGWSGEFPIPDTNYISVPSSLTFYEQILGHLGTGSAVEVAQVLKDASYMVHVEEDPISSALITERGFNSSLLRERAARAAFIDGWKLFKGAGITVEDIRFRFLAPDGTEQTLDLTFGADSLLPHDIHVLIGPNGVGKSQTLMQMVEHWLDPDSDARVGFDARLNLNQMVVVSYSPFERFPLDATGNSSRDEARQDHDVYKYFGLRGRRTIYDPHGNHSIKIRLSQSEPKVNAARALVSCVAHDQKYGAIRGWVKKVETMRRVLSTAIDFDDIAVVVRECDDPDVFFANDLLLRLKVLVKTPLDPNDPKSEPITYLPIRDERVDDLAVDAIGNYLNAGAGVVFLRDGKLVELSSGQRLFTYIVVNILGAIRRNSLVLIDEPELFLHPTLEIAFLTMLKDILSSYGSKALLATHSLVTVRELPRSCVHVFEKTDDGLFIKHPPFETFGGDIQRISSYVFGDRSVSKPFEAWIRDRLEEFDSPEALIAALGDDINEEMIIQISAMGAGKW